MNTTDLVLNIIVGTLASARIVRLLTWDHYPPAVWLRMKWDAKTEQSEWNLLLHCGYCAAPWVVLLNGGAGVLAHEFAPTWVWLTWVIFNAWLAMSYVAAIVMAYDGDDDD